ncbi:MAG: hypothetical protein JXR51_14445 [Bacteroidales bacterium]|nr:hypothetical protein [Bacteroidales bacterium]MBN2758370.1 hypothetical protein [Bacteroidales bacterium]
MRKFIYYFGILIFFGLLLISCNKNNDDEASKLAIIFNHSNIDISNIPSDWINTAKENLHIAYGHTSHGSQIIDGMTGLMNWKGDLYKWTNGDTEGALDIRDGVIAGDLGHNGDLAWESTTRSYLDDYRNEDINVIIWSWCGGVSDNTEGGINIYLNAMDKLEKDYPDVKFVYMTGHLDGTGLEGNLHIRNEQIRNFCKTNNKILYDFADIESYDPDGNYYLDKYANDGCYYDSDSNGSLNANWAINWQNSHTLNVDWYNCNTAHSEPINGNMKAYAAWYLWTRLAGWDGN